MLPMFEVWRGGIKVATFAIMQDAMGFAAKHDYEVWKVTYERVEL